MENDMSSQSQPVLAEMAIGGVADSGLVMELKLCPWCARRPVYDHTRADGVRFSCANCDDAEFEDFQAAAKFWNSRVDDANPNAGWQPISTAPLVGMAVVWEPGSEPLICYRDRNHDGIWISPEKAKHVEPTLWLPLVAPSS